MKWERMICERWKIYFEVYVIRIKKDRSQLEPMILIVFRGNYFCLGGEDPVKMTEVFAVTLRII